MEPDDHSCQSSGFITFKRYTCTVVILYTQRCKPVERFRFFNVYVYDKRCSERDAINGISGSGNPTIVRVSQD